MSTGQTLIEPSLAAAIQLIDQAADLPPQTRRHWACSLRQIARAFDKPLEVIPARYSAIRPHMFKLHHAVLGVTPKTLANHRSNCRAALLWLTKEKSVSRHGAPLTSEWASLRSTLSDRAARSTLSPFMRFCSAKGIHPDAVEEGALADYMAYRYREMARRTSTMSERVLARCWNSMIATVDGWPSRRLNEPPPREWSGPAWDDFPVGLRQEADCFLETIAQVRRSRSGQILRPCKQSTIELRRRQIELFAKRAVRLGAPIEQLSTLAALVEPDVVEKVLDWYWKRNGEAPGTYTVDLARTLLTIARTCPSITETKRSRLEELCAVLDQNQPTGLTDKNVALIRQVLTEGVWTRIVNLPTSLMAQARARLSEAPIQAGVSAQVAVAIAILTVAPIRRGNLLDIRLDKNLIKPSGPDSNFWLVFPDYDVKNRVRLEFPLNDRLSDLLDEYVHDFRPALLRGQNHDWLFTGRAGVTKPITFKQLSKRIYKATGLWISVHQFRHAAGALLLKKYPGNYELVRRVLGHRNMRTTVNYYCGLENVHASEIFSDLVCEHMTVPEKVG